MSRITYTEKDGPRGRRVQVRLAGKHVGTITPDGQKWRYFPKGRNVPGEAFTTIEKVKRSLETDND